MQKHNLRILYIHKGTRADGLEYIHCRPLLAELHLRNHEVRSCWAVHDSLTAQKDTAINVDLISPSMVRRWNPNAIIFEHGLFIGDPRCPQDLLDELQRGGTIVVAFIPPAEYRFSSDVMANYDAWLAERGLKVLQPSKADRDQPICKSRQGWMLRTSVTELQRHSSMADSQLYQGVTSIAVGSAIPFDTWSNALLVGGEGVYIKAYDHDAHGSTSPIYGVFNDRQFRTEAIFLCSLPPDPYSEVSEYDTPRYIANLVEVLWRLKSQSMQTNVESDGTEAVASPNLRVTSEVVERAIDDAETLLSNSGATSGVDRIHTAVHGYLQLACDQASIRYDADSSAAKLLKALRLNHPNIRQLGPHSEEVGKILTGFGSVLDALNTLRNRGSIAHPNPVLLNHDDALLCINVARSILHYLDAKLCNLTPPVK